MSDGLRLAARLWLPDTSAGNPVPAILEYIPYRKRDMVRVRDERNHPEFAANGYACVRVDMRGSGDSEGVMTDMYEDPELDDAIEVIDWISKQDWCDGSVGMMGTSWGGTSALQAASRRPSALKAVIAVCATDNRYEDDIHHMGGCLLTDSVEWGATLPTILASPPDPQTVGPRWREMWMERLEALSFPLENWVRHETRDDYWRHGSVSERPEAITCPVLVIGGWSDRYSNTVMNFLANSHQKTWGIVGAWGHHYPDQGCPGPAIGFQQEAVRWWDRWLKKVDNHVDREPRLRVWLQQYCPPRNRMPTRPGRWVAEHTWPFGNVSRSVLGLSPGTLHWQPDGSTDEVELPTARISGASSGDTGYFGRDGGLPLDQRPDDANALVFETPPLEYPVEILGRCWLNVGFRTDKPNAILVARLNDVPPDEPIARVTYGVRNLALNDDLDGPVPNIVEGNNTCRIDFHNIAYRFEAGHRIRLALSDSYWPMIFPSPEPAQITLALGNTSLVLPLRGAADGVPEVVFATQTKCATESTYQTVTDSELIRASSADDGSGRRIAGWHQPLRHIRYPDIDLGFATASSARHTINNLPPWSPATTYTHELRYCRDGWDIRIEGSASLRETEGSFELEGQITAFENGALIFERRWNPVIRRKVS